jgi:hypothetical protein
MDQDGGQLRDGEDEDEVEEELDGRDAELALPSDRTFRSLSPMPSLIGAILVTNSVISPHCSVRDAL